MKTILYATDCSKHSVGALAYAHQLCLVLGADLVVLHVYDLPPITVSTIRAPAQIKKLAFHEHFDLLKNYVEKYLDDRTEGVKVYLRLVENTSIVEGILSKSRELRPDMVLVGMKGTHTLRGFFSGNIAKALIDRVHCPLLIIPNDLAHCTISNIVYGTDFEEDDIIALRTLVRIAEPFGARIYAVHIPTTGEFSGEEQLSWFNEMLSQKVGYAKLEFKLFRHQGVYKGLSAYMVQVNADMVALLERQGEGFFRKLFHKGLVKKMESSVNFPLLSLNA
ncbi:universal stress protein [Flavobacteriaceae bacterium 3-367]|uniref:universal stress protein n=1 Tax=Eudoraea algarum TaxID=3417568 RepID=UPI00327C8752